MVPDHELSERCCVGDHDIVDQFWGGDAATNQERKNETDVRDRE
jgi:hypothetical protein